jgi:sialic acid synthase SpsE
MNIKIGKKIIGDAKPCYLIGEAGVNHNGSLDLAINLIDVAVSAGVDAVKFQSFKTENLINEGVEKAPYQKGFVDSGENQFQMLKRLEMTIDQMARIKDYCVESGVEFLSTPFDEESLDELEQLGVSAYKVSSTDLTNLPFLIKVAQKNKPVFLSTGMSYFDEISLAVKTFEKFNSQLVLMHCTANYPILDSEVNLKNILRLQREFPGFIIGFSDHSQGVGAAPYSLPLGAKVIEKHFTLDKTMDGPDHLASLSPCELIDFVRQVRRAESFLGSELKYPTVSESLTRLSLQKCLVAKKDIFIGELFSEENVVAKRTGGKGISPIYFERVFGQNAKKNFRKNEVIEL